MKRIKKILTYIVFFMILIVITINIVNSAKSATKKIHLPDIITEETLINLKSEYPNTDIVAILTIPNTTINEVVVQYTDNDYYLTHNIYKEKDKLGSIFLDYRLDIDDKKLIIYGHNSKTLKPPFKELENYYSEDYYQNNKQIILTTNKGQKKYEIFSIYIDTGDFKYLNITFNDNKWKEHLEYLKSLSMYKSDVKIKENDKILILQTCSYLKNYKAYKEKYLIIVAKET